MSGKVATYFEVMFELEGLVAFSAFELPENGALVVANHVPLQAVDIGERLVADFAGLEKKINNIISRVPTLFIRRFTIL